MSPESTLILEPTIACPASARRTTLTAGPVSELALRSAGIRLPGAQRISVEPGEHASSRTFRGREQASGAMTLAQSTTVRRRELRLAGRQRAARHGSEPSVATGVNP